MNSPGWNPGYEMKAEKRTPEGFNKGRERQENGK